MTWSFDTPSNRAASSAVRSWSGLLASVSNVISFTRPVLRVDTVGVQSNRCEFRYPTVILFSVRLAVAAIVSHDRPTCLNEWARRARHHKRHSPGPEYGAEGFLSIGGSKRSVARKGDGWQRRPRYPY